MAERRLAITIKGAVSLGAYEAGAIEETLRLIAFNNSVGPAQTQWYVDAACGASAGSMTSAMVAAALVRGDTSVLRKTWVTGVSIGMLAPEGQPLSPNSILDATALDRLAAQNLTCPTIANRHPALRPPPSEISLRFTLSRYAPDVVAQDTLNRTKVMYREFKDSANFTIAIKQAQNSPNVGVDIKAKDVASWGYHNASELLSGSDAWSALVQTAIASGSFPFAFAPRDLRRWIDGSWMDRYFQDGGTFDNDPIGETINIAHDIDWSDKPEAENFSDADRRFLMIHVEPFDGVPPETIPNAAKTLDVNPLTLAQKFFPAILDESENSGLRGIVQVNQKIVERGKFLNDLANLVADGKVQALPRSILEALAKYRHLEARLDFLRANLVPDLASDATLFAKVSAFSIDKMQAFIDLALAYDLATNLADKVTLKPILIAPAQRLSGSGLYAFGGFLVSKMRERDYAQGVYDAYQAWKIIASDPNEDFQLAPDAPEAPPSTTEIFPSCEDEYKKGIEQLINRVDAVIGALSDAATGPGILGAAESKIVSTALDAIAKHYLRKQGDSTET